VRDAFIEETNQGMGALRTLSWQRALLGTGPRMLTPYLKGLVPGRTQHEAVAMTPRTTFWRLLLENGIVGFATWLAAVGVLLGHLFADARRNHHATALLGGTLALVMTFLAFDASQHLGIQVLFWSALGLAAGIHAGRDGTPAVYRILRARDAL
jgi:O-antigen ligase